MAYNTSPSSSAFNVPPPPPPPHPPPPPALLPPTLPSQRSGNFLRLVHNTNDMDHTSRIDCNLKQTPNVFGRPNEVPSNPTKLFTTVATFRKYK